MRRMYPIFLFVILVGVLLFGGTFPLTAGDNLDKLQLTEDQKRLHRLSQSVNDLINAAIANGSVSELKGFQLQREIEGLVQITEEEQKIPVDVTVKNALLEDIQLRKTDAFSKIRNIVVSDWREHSPELSKVMNRVDAMMSIRGNYDSCDGLTDTRLKSKLQTLVSGHKNLGYTGARQKMFSELDNVGGYVTCVYTGRKVKTNSIPSAQGSQSMNTEHTWPKSKGAKAEPAKADIFHLFPTDTQSNSKRSSLPFGNVSNPSWSQGGSTCDGNCFMPPAAHRGNVARAMFYFSIRYNHKLDSAQESALKQWHKADPVDACEKKRNEGICKLQGNRNPFIDRPDFVDKISDF